MIAKANVFDMSNSGWTGVTLNGWIKDGPKTMIGKQVEMRLSFEQVESLYTFYLETKQRAEESAKRVALINASNCEGGGE